MHPADANLTAVNDFRRYPLGCRHIWDAYLHNGHLQIFSLFGLHLNLKYLRFS